MEDEEAMPHCSFCGKRASRARPLFAGRERVWICGACVLLCSDLMAEERPITRRPKPAPARRWWRRRGR